MKKILLYSGGSDCELIRRIWKPDVLLYVDMKTPYSEAEMNKIKAKRDDVTFVSFDLNQFESHDSIIPLRNLYLLMIATNQLKDGEEGEVCLGALRADTMPDKTTVFLRDTERLLQSILIPSTGIEKGIKVKVNTDFKNKSKHELIEMCVKEGISLQDLWHDSFSCYHPVDDEECFNCKACFKKFAAFYCLEKKYGNEGLFSFKQLKTMEKFIKDVCIPDKEHILDDRGIDGKDLEEVISVVESGNHL